LLAFTGLKRRSILAGGSLFALLLVAATAITGCSASTAQPAASSTPAVPATTQVTVNAISGSITQSVMVAFTVQ
jgi:hypothetical protein